MGRGRPRKPDAERLSERIALNLTKTQREKYESWDDGPAFLRRMIDHRDLKDAEAKEAEAAAIEAEAERLKVEAFQRAADLRREAEDLVGKSTVLVEKVYQDYLRMGIDKRALDHQRHWLTAQVDDMEVVEQVLRRAGLIGNTGGDTEP